MIRYTVPVAPLLICAVAILTTIPAAQAQEAATPAQPQLAKPAPIAISRKPAPIAVDGDLSDSGWEGAAKIDQFFETSPGDNIPAKVTTVALLTYDEHYLYIGLRVDDPNPGQIRAPFVDRDQVFGTDDNVAVFIDTRNEGKTALELRVSPRGIQADAVFNDATSSEDFAPDFFYDTAAKLTSTGWTAEMRVPFSSLRYPEGTDPQTWRFLIWRNYPRDFRYAFHSAPIPRGANCIICHAHAVTGFAGLPDSNHLVVAPYVTANQLTAREEPGDITTDFGTDETFDGGVDVKWNPDANSTIDVTFNPDFSQIEADVPQIAVNERFALFFPEKRPFFLESVDLLDTPIQAVYTRTLTEPKWGLRGTGASGSTEYTLLLTNDEGGGLAILPGPFGSSFAFQEFESTVGIGRLRHGIGNSFVGGVFTHREIDGGGHNTVIGPDFQWRPNESDSVTAQVLWSDSETPNRPDLAAEWNGQSLSSHAAEISWEHRTRTLSWELELEDFGDEFRADTGFVPQSGYREAELAAAYRFYPTGFLRMVQPFAVADFAYDRDGEPLVRTLFPGLFLTGSRNLAADFQFRYNEQINTGERLLEQSYVRYFLQIDPSRRFPRIGINGRIGEQIDFANHRVGDGTTIGVNATIRPTDHLELLLTSNRQWLDVDANPNGSGFEAQSGRLFTAEVQRLKATYTFSANALLRLIGQYVETNRNPELYGFPVGAQSGSFLGSALFSYKLNWQTVFFLGYGDNQILTGNDDLVGVDRSLFMKVSYAIQR